MPLAIVFLREQGIGHLLGGTLAMLAGAFGSLFFVAERSVRSPGLRAIASAAPIAIMVLVARCMGHEDVAIGVLFGTSVAMLSTAVGSISSVAPVGPAPSRWRRIWGFTLTAALLTFIAGFTGFVNWIAAVALALEGGLALWLWSDTTAHDTDVTDDHYVDPPPRDAGSIRWRAAVLPAIASLLLVAWGSYLATKGALTFSAMAGHVPPGTLAATLLSISLVMPAMQSGRKLAMAGRSWVPMTSQAGVVLINLCLLLPLLALAPYIGSHGSELLHRWLPDSVAILPLDILKFPWSVWRVDAVLLMVLSALFLPVSLGRWNLGKEDGMLLVIVYFIYLIATTAIVART